MALQNLPMRRAGYLASAVCWIGVAIAAAQPGPTRSLRGGDVEVLIEPYPRGVSIIYDGVTISSGSELVVTTPPWTPHYYLGPDRKSVEGAAIEKSDEMQRATLTHRSVEGSVEGREVWTVYPDHRIEHEFECRFLKGGAEALIHFRLAALHPAPFGGRAYEVTNSKGETARRIAPVLPDADTDDESSLGDNFRKLHFDSRLGPIDIAVESTFSLICYDHRKSTWADPARPQYWMGDSGHRFRSGETVRYRVSYRLPPCVEKKPPRESSVFAAATTATDAAQQWPNPFERLVPMPKSVERREGRWQPTRGAKLRFSLAPDADKAAALLNTLLRERFSAEASPVDDASKADIRFTTLKSPPTAEAYELSVAASGVELRAADERGFDHAARTLRQLACVDASGGFVPAVEIRDRPDLAFRGMHLFTGGKGPALHEALLRDVIAALKMNTLVLQCDYVEWDGHPEIHHKDWGMSKEDVRAVLKVAAEQSVEVIPLIMSPGHMQWMFNNDQNLDLCEDPDFKYQYCITNPRTYEFLFSVYEETLDLFNPRTLHIGHDEFTDRGRVPFRESSKPYTVEQLFLMDTKRVVEWLNCRGVGVMMWGDMLLTRGEAPDATNAPSRESARRKREAVSKDVVISDWHYAAVPAEQFQNLAVFHEAGFNTVAASWNRPLNIVNYAHAAAQSGSLGLLQTTWGGYSLDPASFEIHFQQYAAAVLAAEAAWNASGHVDPDGRPYGDIFCSLIGRSALKPDVRRGWTLDLSTARNAALAASSPDEWLGFGPRHDLSRAPGGDTRLAGVRFDCGPSSQAGAAAAIILDGKLTRSFGYPRALELKLDSPRTAAQLVVLHAATFAAPRDTVVGEYRVRYTDGTEAAIELRYGRNIVAYDDPAALPDAPVVWWGKTPSDQTVALRALVWNGLDATKSIVAVGLCSAAAAGGPMVLAITGLEPAK